MKELLYLLTRLGISPIPDRSAMPDRLAIPDKLRPSVLVSHEEEKDQDEDRNGPSGIPRKAQGFIISEKNEGEFVML